MLRLPVFPNPFATLLIRQGIDKIDLGGEGRASRIGLLFTLLSLLSNYGWIISVQHDLSAKFYCPVVHCCGKYGALTDSFEVKSFHLRGLVD